MLIKTKLLITFECSKQAQREYETRHDWVEIVQEIEIWPYY